MSWQDWGDVRKGRGLRASDLAKAGGRKATRKTIDGAAAANDAARGVRSDKSKKVRNVKGLKGKAKKDLTPGDVRKLEGIARVRERGGRITDADKNYLKRMGFPVHKDM